jgi:hypothetical protein
MIAISCFNNNLSTTHTNLKNRQILPNSARDRSSIFLLPHPAGCPELQRSASTRALILSKLSTLGQVVSLICTLRNPQQNQASDDIQTSSNLGILSSTKLEEKRYLILFQQLTRH